MKAPDIKKLKTTGHDSEWQPKYFAMLCGLFCGLYVITGAVNSKLIEIGGLVLPAGILIFPLCCIITDLMTEVYGFNRTRQAVWTTLICILLYAAFTQTVMQLPHPSFWEHQADYENIFATSWRLALAGCVAWVFGEFSNSYIMTKLKIRQNASYMPVRFIASTAVGQFFDTIIFMTIAFLGTMPLGDFLTMAIAGWVLKVTYEIFALPLSIPITKKIKQLEGVEHFDRQKISLV